MNHSAMLLLLFTIISTTAGEQCAEPKGRPCSNRGAVWDAEACRCACDDGWCFDDRGNCVSFCKSPSLSTSPLPSFSLSPSAASTSKGKIICAEPRPNYCATNEEYVYNEISENCQCETVSGSSSSSGGGGNTTNNNLGTYGPSCQERIEPLGFDIAQGLFDCIRATCTPVADPTKNDPDNIAIRIVQLKHQLGGQYEEGFAITVTSCTCDEFVNSCIAQLPPSQAPSSVPSLSSRPSQSSAPSKSSSPSSSNRLTLTSSPTLSSNPSSSSKPSVSVSPSVSLNPSISSSPVVRNSCVAKRCNADKFWSYTSCSCECSNDWCLGDDRRTCVPCIGDEIKFPTASPALKPSASPSVLAAPTITSIPTKSWKPSPIPSRSFFPSSTSSGLPSASPLPSSSSLPSSLFLPSLSTLPTITSPFIPSQSWQPSQSSVPSKSLLPSSTAIPRLIPSPILSSTPSSSFTPSTTGRISSIPSSSPKPSVSVSPSGSARPSAAISFSPSTSSVPSLSTKPCEEPRGGCGYGKWDDRNCSCDCDPGWCIAKKSLEGSCDEACDVGDENDNIPADQTSSPTISLRPSASLAPSSSTQPSSSRMPSVTASFTPSQSWRPSLSPIPSKSAFPSSTSRPTFMPSTTGRISNIPSSSPKPSASVSPSGSARPSAAISFSPSTSSVPSLSAKPCEEPRGGCGYGKWDDRNCSCDCDPGWCIAKKSLEGSCDEACDVGDENDNIPADQTSSPTISLRPSASLVPSLSTQPSFSALPSIAALLPSNNENLVPSASPSLHISPDYPENYDGGWYPDWDNPESTKCLNDGHEPSYMTSNPQYWIHPTQLQCCRTYFSWAVDECLSQPPTQPDSPHNGYHYYPDWSGDNSCINDGNHPSYMDSNPEYLFGTLLECCEAYYPWNVKACIGAEDSGSDPMPCPDNNVNSSFSSATNDGNNLSILYYPDWTGDRYCINDGKAPQYMYDWPSTWLSGRLQDCCFTYYQFDLEGCMGTSKTIPLSNCPTSAPVDNTSGWFVDWPNYRCVKSCVGPFPCYGIANYFEETYSSLNECEHKHLSWKKKYG